MITDSNFFDTEANSPLLTRNNGFLSATSFRSALIQAEMFPDLVKTNLVALKTFVTPPVLPPSIQRIFEVDAERTFSSPEHRALFVSTLTDIYFEVDEDYHQGLGFVVAYLLLYLPSMEVTKIVNCLHTRYMQGYFKTSPFNYVRDARVHGKLMKRYFPSLWKRITDAAPPEAYCSKWFVGLNVHILPFEALHLFFEKFFAIGERFLFQFSMSLLKHCEKELLEESGAEKILKILRLDIQFYENDKKASDGKQSFFVQIVEDAVVFDLNDINLAIIREECAEELRIEAENRKTQESMLLDESDDEIIFSDEDENGDIISAQ